MRSTVHNKTRIEIDVSVVRSEHGDVEVTVTESDSLSALVLPCPPDLAGKIDRAASVLGISPAQFVLEAAGRRVLEVAEGTERPLPSTLAERYGTAGITVSITGAPPVERELDGESWVFPAAPEPPAPRGCEWTIETPDGRLWRASSLLTFDISWDRGAPYQRDLRYRRGDGEWRQVSLIGDGETANLALDWLADNEPELVRRAEVMPRDAATAAAELAARILRVWERLLDSMDRADPHAQAADRLLASAWEALPGAEPDELAAARSAVEEAERLVGGS